LLIKSLSLAPEDLREPLALSGIDLLVEPAITENEVIGVVVLNVLKISGSLYCFEEF
jgi:hypothetical protein